MIIYVYLRTHVYTSVYDNDQREQKSSFDLGIGYCNTMNIQSHVKPNKDIQNSGGGLLLDQPLSSSL